MRISGGSYELQVGGQLDVPADGVAAVGERELKAQAPYAPIDVRTEVERSTLGPEWVTCRRSIAAFGCERAGDAADRQLALDAGGAVGAGFDRCRAERESRVLACLEEVVAVQDVLAKLGRLGDRDRCGDRARGQRPLAVCDEQPSLDVVERGAECRDDVLDGELHRRVDGVDVVGPGERLHYCRHGTPLE